MTGPSAATGWRRAIAGARHRRAPAAPMPAVPAGRRSAIGMLGSAGTRRSRLSAPWLPVCGTPLPQRRRPPPFPVPSAAAGGPHLVFGMHEVVAGEILPVGHPAAAILDD